MSDFDIIVYGATGYTGRLVCEYLPELHLPFIAAGRDRARTQAVLDKIPGIETEPQRMPPSIHYAMMDGLFQQSLLKHLSGDPQAISQMQADVRLVLSKIAPNPALA